MQKFSAAVTKKLTVVVIVILTLSLISTASLAAARALPASTPAISTTDSPTEQTATDYNSNGSPSDEPAATQGQVKEASTVNEIEGEVGESENASTGTIFSFWWLFGFAGVLLLLLAIWSFATKHKY